MSCFVKTYMLLATVVLIFGGQETKTTAKEMSSLGTVQNVAEVIPLQKQEEDIPAYEEVCHMSEPIVTEEPKQKEYRYIKDCPLSKEIQEGIFDICESYNVSFEFVMSVIAQESSFKADAKGDGCESKGLMQIQMKWHGELMEELGVTDLYNPIENVRVGVAILHSYFQENEEVAFVLMKYNGGEAYAHRMVESGKVSDYAKEIMERAIMYEEENGI